MSYCSTYMTSNYFQSEIEVTTAAPAAFVEVPVSLFVIPFVVPPQHSVPHFREIFRFLRFY